MGNTLYTELDTTFAKTVDPDMSAIAEAVDEQRREILPALPVAPGATEQSVDMLSSVLGAVRQGQTDPTAPKADPKIPSFADAVKADFAANTWIGALIENYSAGVETGAFEDQDQRTLTAQEVVQGLEAAGHSDKLPYARGIRTLADLQQKIMQWSQYEQDKAVIESTGVGKGLAAAFVSGLSNPLNWIPLGRAALTTAKSTRVAAARTGAEFAAVESVNQGAISAMQPARTATEVAANIGAATFFGVMTGGALHKLIGAKAAARSEDHLQNVANTHADIAAKQRPDLAPGTVRVYHGGSDYDGGPRWFTTNKAYAEGYAAKSPNGKVFYLDIPEDHPMLHTDYPETQGVDSGFTFAAELSEAEAKNMKLLGADAEPEPKAPASVGAAAVSAYDQHVSQIGTDAPLPSFKAHEIARLPGSGKLADFVPDKFRTYAAEAFAKLIPGERGQKIARYIQESKDRAPNGLFSGLRMPFYDLMNGASATERHFARMFSLSPVLRQSDVAAAQSGKVQELPRPVLQVFKSDFMGPYATAYNDSVQAFEKEIAAHLFTGKKPKTAVRMSREYQELWQRFDKEVAKLLTREEAGHEVPIIEKTAKAYRKILDDVHTRLAEVSVLPAGVDLSNAQRYFPLVEDLDQMRLRKDEWVQLHTDAFAQHIADELNKLDQIEAAIRAEIDKIEVELAGEEIKIPTGKTDAEGKPIFETMVTTRGLLQELKDEVRGKYEGFFREELKAKQKEEISKIEQMRDAEIAELDDKLAAEAKKINDEHRNALARLEAQLVTDIDLATQRLGEVKKEGKASWQINNGRRRGASLSEEKGRLQLAAAKQRLKFHETSQLLGKEATERYAKKVADVTVKYEIELAVAKEKHSQVNKDLTKAKNDALKQVERKVRAEIKERTGIVLDSTEDLIDLKKLRSKVKKQTNVLDDKAEAIRSIAEERALRMYDTKSRLKVRHVTDYDVDATGVAGYAKARSNLVLHEKLMSLGFARSNASEIMYSYVQKAGADAAMYSVFTKLEPERDAAGKIIRDGPDGTGPMKTKRVGDVGLADVKRRIADYYDNLIDERVLTPRQMKILDKRSKTAKPEEVEALRNQFKAEAEVHWAALRSRAIENVDLLRTFLRRDHLDKPVGAALEKGTEFMRNANHVLYNGGSVLASLGDVNNIGMAAGYANLGRVLFSRNFWKRAKDAWSNADTDSRRYARLAGANLERGLNSALYQMVDLHNPFVSRDKGVVGMSRQVADVFSRFALLVTWADLWKDVAATTFNHALIQDAQLGWDALGKAARTRYASLRIDKERLGKILQEWEKQQEKFDQYGESIARPDTWEDRSIAQVYQDALNAEVGNQIITPGPIDKIAWQGNLVGQLLTQFKGFMLPTQNAVFARNFQLAQIDPDKGRQVAIGMALYTMIGAFISETKRAISEADTDNAVFDRIAEEWSNNPGQALYHALDRASLGYPIVFEASNIADKLGMGGLRGVLGAFDEEDLQGGRIKNRSKLGIILGPSMQTSETLLSVPGAIKSFITNDEDDEDHAQDFGRQEYRTLKTVVPGTSIPVIQYFVKQGEKNFLAPHFNWPDK